MDKKKLEKYGWKVGSTADFLNLSKEEKEIVYNKISSKHRKTLNKLAKNG